MYKLSVSRGFVQAGRDEAAVAKAAKQDALAAKRERLKAAVLSQQVAAIKARKQQQQQQSRGAGGSGTAGVGAAGAAKAGGKAAEGPK